MTNLFSETKLYIYTLGTFLMLPFLFGWISHAANDLLWDIFEITKESDTMLDLWENVDTVWAKMIHWSVEMWIGGDDSGVGMSAPITVKITRILLILTIALSVTMILYNWMIYIIETWQWKEWKSLIKNVILIVVGILVSLFSVVIINLIQSIPTTLDDELINSTHPKDKDKDYLKSEGQLIKGKKMWWDEVGEAFKDMRCETRHTDEHCKEWKNKDGNNN